MTENYPAIAAAVYQACNHFDPYLPPLSEDLARAWGRLFERHRLSTADLLAGVDKVYDEHSSGYRPLPKDIVDAARAIRRERDAHAGPSPEYEALCESKQGPDAPEVRAFLERSERFGKRPGTATAEAQERIQEMVRKQREADPPQPMDAD